MLAILQSLIPEVLILFSGYFAMRLGWFSDDARKGIAKFAFGFAMPIMLFNRISTLEFPDRAPWDLWIAYIGATIVTMLVMYIAARSVRRLGSVSGATLSLGSTFSNTVMLGIPFHLGVLGPEAAYPVYALVSIHVLALVMFATLLAEWKDREGILKSLLRAGADAFKNPIIIGLLLGLAWNLTGLPLPDLLAVTTGKIGDAAFPVALFTLGLTLAGLDLAGDVKNISFMMVGKLIVHPLIVAFAVLVVFDLPPIWTAVCLLNAVLPTGMNGFLFAGHYSSNERSVAGAILLSTLVSIPVYALAAAYIL